MVVCPYVRTYVANACQIIRPRDLKIGTNIQLDPGSNLVNVRTPGGGNFAAARPKNSDFYMLK